MYKHLIYVCFIWFHVYKCQVSYSWFYNSSSCLRLSDRNCIELVQRLIQLNLIDVIYTIDGKEYLTPEELSKEIREELYVHGGA